MKLFAPENVQYLLDLVCEFGEITIESSLALALSIEADGYDRGITNVRRVRVLYNGEPIAEYNLTTEGIAQGLSMLKLAGQKDYKDLHQMVRDINIKKFGESYYE